jgi:gas vesicle protein
VTWMSLIAALVVGLTGIGFAQVLRTVFGRRLAYANADRQIVQNAKEIIDELKERNAEILIQWKSDVADLRAESDALRKQLQEEREAARIETERLYQEIAIKDRKISTLSKVSVEGAA